MKSIALHTGADEIDAAIEKLKAAQCQLILVFSSVAVLENSAVVAKIRQGIPSARLLGCSTAGEIGDHIGDDSVSLMGLRFEATPLECSAVVLERTEDSREAGAKLARSLMKEGLKGIFVISPGLNVNGSEMVAGIKEVLPGHVWVSGGLAGDGTRFGKTCVVLDDGVSDKQAVAFGLYGDNVHIHSGSRGGWKPFGPLRRVTRVDKNVLYEVDGKPALALYKEYLGDKVNELPSSGLLYPFAILNDHDQEGQQGLIRTILGVDENENSLTFAGNLEKGSVVSFMHASTDELREGARAATVKAVNGYQADADAALICVSCVGRRILMGEDTEEEIDAVREAAPGVPMAGFYSYGEIGHHDDSDETELHNETMTVTFISENVR